jgi:hypothetical protein
MSESQTTMSESQTTMSARRARRRVFNGRDGDDIIDEIEDLSGEEDREMNNSNPPQLTTDGYGRWCRRVDNAVSHIF